MNAGIMKNTAERVVEENKSQNERTNPVLLEALYELLQLPDQLARIQKQVEAAASSVNAMNRLQNNLCETMECQQDQLSAIHDGQKCFETFSKQAEDLKRSFYKERIIQPLATKLVALVDLVDDLEKGEALTSDTADLLRNEIVNLLNDYLIEEIPVDNGDYFNAATSKPAEIVPTGEATKDGKVVEVIRKGFRWEDNDILRHVMVSVYRKDEKAEITEKGE